MDIIKTLTALILIVTAGAVLAVNSSINIFADTEELDGETEKIVIDSDGLMSLSMDYEELFGELPDSWTVNCLAARDGGVYAGTSPNGIIYFCGFDGEAVEMYRPETEAAGEDDGNAGEDEAQAVSQISTNLHVFAMKTLADGSLLAGMSGEKCKLLKISKDGDTEELFDGTAEDIKDSVAIAEGKDGEIFLGKILGGIMVRTTAPDVIVNRLPIGLA